VTNFLAKSCTENQNTHFIFNNIFFLENRAVYEKTWKNMVEPDRPQTTLWRMRIACWIPKAINTHSEYVIRIAFHRNHSYTKAPHRYDIHTLPDLYHTLLTSHDAIPLPAHQYKE
jgi:hypothetical protein